MNHNVLINQLRNSYIKNDNAQCRELYFELCEMCELHREVDAEEYRWPWIYENDLGILQHAPERKYIRGKKQLTLDILSDMYSQFQIYKDKAA